MELKLKFIFNIAAGRSCPSAISRHARPWLTCLLTLLAMAVPLSAQHPDAVPVAPPVQPLDQPITMTLSDPPPEDNTEALLPHFRDTRFWLSGQANFVFQTHPEFHAP